LPDHAATSTVDASVVPPDRPGTTRALWLGLATLAGGAAAAAALVLAGSSAAGAAPGDERAGGAGEAQAVPPSAITGVATAWPEAAGAVAASGATPDPGAEPAVDPQLVPVPVVPVLDPAGSPAAPDAPDAPATGTPPGPLPVAGDEPLALPLTGGGSDTLPAAGLEPLALPTTGLESVTAAATDIVPGGPGAAEPADLAADIPDAVDGVLDGLVPTGLVPTGLLPAGPVPDAATGAAGAASPEAPTGAGSPAAPAFAAPDAGMASGTSVRDTSVTAGAASIAPAPSPDAANIAPSPGWSPSPDAPGHRDAAPGGPERLARASGQGAASDLAVVVGPTSPPPVGPSWSLGSGPRSPGTGPAADITTPPD
jgi:hypothetical protein